MISYGEGFSKQGVILSSGSVGNEHDIHGPAGPGGVYVRLDRLHGAKNHAPLRQVLEKLSDRR